ncbi:sec7 guanine nucleotide exchange factor [Pseudohyphozyma bogoriensis]|nr:sec7 guanine nucleotide exchange factor [Pseudohyphozyma bogoriensis]
MSQDMDEHPPVSPPPAAQDTPPKDALDAAPEQPPTSTFAPAPTPEDGADAPEVVVEPSTPVIDSAGDEDERGDDTALSEAESRVSTSTEKGDKPRPISKDFTASSPPSPPPKADGSDEVNGTHTDAPAAPAPDALAAPTPDESTLPRSDSAASEGAFEDVALSKEGSVQPESPAPTPETEPAPPPLPSRSPPPPQHQNGSTSPSPAPSAPVMSRSNTSTSVSTQGAPDRRSSVASTNTISAPGSSSLVSGILVVTALETIAASKEAKKSKPLKDAVDKALEALKHPLPSMSATSGGTVDPHVIFAPLRLACETKSLPLMITALDCIGKLVSYDFFVDRQPHVVAEVTEDGDVLPGAEGQPMALADLVTTTVCDCFSPSPTSTSNTNAAPVPGGATTQHDTLLLRLLSSLLSLILSSTLSVHQSSLLKSVRTVYNVFLMGSPGTVQTVAQATLGQIVGGVFGRISLGEAALSNGLHSSANGSRSGSQAGSVNASASASRTDLSTVAEDDPVPMNGDGDAGETEKEETKAEADIDAERTPKLGGSAELPEVEVLPPPDGEPAPPAATVAPIPASAISAESTEDVTIGGSRASFEGTTTASGHLISPNDLFIKDAFLVFRALCKLSMKPLGADSERDLKSHAMRSKMLSLHLVLSILSNHIALFVDPNVVIHSSTSRERTPFIQAVKQYLCLALSRNAVSPVIQVFELSCEIFWRVLSGMRTKLKKEIEVLLNEIFLPILEMRNSTVRQKSILLAVFGRLAQDPQALVDIYLNYDCDRSSLDNIYERLINIVSKLGTTHFPSTTERPGTSTVSAAASSPFPTGGASLSEDAKFSDVPPGQSLESHLKRQSLETLVSVLRSLVSWAGRGTVVAPVPATPITPSDSSSSLSASRNSEETARTSETDLHASLSSSRGGAGSGSVTPDVVPSDDPSRFENAKQRKTTLLEGIKKFNFKPKRGIAFLIDTGFIRSSEPKDIARFLLNADGLDKAQIGEYLGEGDAENIATMHAFVDYMDFSNSAFVDALRMFLQSFRLPGEAQKIDRYMLKFAERYTAGNPGVFANADTAYILAFSVILLNTDAHNPQVKKPMSKPEFIRNNRGIDDGKDLDEELLSSIYDEINANEIRMKDEVEAAGPQASTGIANAIATVGRDLQREAYVWQSEGMVNKTEALFRTLVRGQRRGAGRPTEQFYSASHFEHVKPMFEVAWMPILAGVSGPLQDTEDIDLITLSLEGFKQAIKIVCLFDLELERNAFVTTLAKFTFLNNFGEMKTKNVEAIKTLLDVAMIDGNYLKGSWREVVTCVSQLERFQLIAQGVDSHALPELGRKPTLTKDRRSTASARSRTNRPTEEVALEARTRNINITADMIFSSTPQLSGTAIVDFVQALSDVSWEEIQASGLAEQPRVFCLQKLVEISYYNMNRIRLEWSNIWHILGEHFNQVTCHTNAKVSFLALDSLRQLAMRFLEKEELANFKFQKDFLKPFEYAMVHNNHPDARDMVLQCLHQMIQARVQNLRSGWRTMFGVFSAAAKVLNERIAVQAFDIVQSVNKEHFSRIIEFGSFADLTVCITDFCKISKYQRASLQAIEMLREVIPMMLSCPECPLCPNSTVVKSEANANDDPMLRFWFPVLFGFYDVIMNGEDLEVRKRALDYLFDTLKKHGQTFPPEFWDTVCKEVLFPIFAVLRSRSDVSRFSTHEDMSVWLSTTMIQALRNLVDLFTFYFDVLARMLDQNDTLARIGTSCLQQLLENNVQKLSPDRWERIVSTFVQLFKTTTAYQLFDENLLITPAEGTSAPETATNPNGFVAPTPLSPAPDQSNGFAPGTKTAYPDRRRVFRQIIVKCVLQLLLIETTHELLQNEGVYTTIPASELLKLMSALDESYRFARKFNADKDLRMALWKVGFMRDLPNLLRQESTSAATLVNVLLRMYNDTDPDHLQKRAEVVDVFAPLAMDVLSNYVALNPETQTRNIAAWTPVCVEILQGFCGFEDEAFKAQLPRLYPLATNTLARDLDPAVRESVRGLFVRVGRSDPSYEGTPSLDELESGVDFDQRCRLIRALLTVRDAHLSLPPAEVMAAIDQHLEDLSTTNSEPLEVATEVPSLRSLFPVGTESEMTIDGRPTISVLERVSFWRGDITRLSGEKLAIVNAANTRMLGCFQPKHLCVDNVFHAAAGPRMREDCATIMSSPALVDGPNSSETEIAEPLVTKGYGLPASYVLHVAGPQIHQGALVTDTDRTLLRNAYTNTLDLVEESGLPIDTVAFPCISTGLFGFPPDQAAPLVISAVLKWLEARPSSPLRVIFALFSSADAAHYTKALAQLYPTLPPPMTVQKRVTLPSRVFDWVQESDSIIIHAGAGMSADAVHDDHGLGLDYTSEALFANLYPGLLKSTEMTCLYHSIGYRFEDPLVQWAFYLAHYRTVLSWGKTPLYSTLLDLASTKSSYSVLTSNVDNLFRQSGFDTSRIWTPQGTYTLLQCLDACTPNSLQPTEPWAERAYRDGAIDPQVMRLPDDSYVPRCDKCGGEVFLNVRGGDWFLETPMKGQRERYYHQVAEMVEEKAKAKGKPVLLLEIGAGFNTPSVVRWPGEALVRKYKGAVKLVRLNPQRPEIPSDIKDDAVGLKVGAVEFFDALKLVQ